MATFTVTVTRIIGGRVNRSEYNFSTEWEANEWVNKMRASDSTANYRKEWTINE